MDVDALEAGHDPPGHQPTAPPQVVGGWEVPLVAGAVVIMGQILSDTIAFDAVLFGTPVAWLDVVTPFVGLLLTVAAAGAWILRRHRVLRLVVVAFCVIATVDLLANVIQLMITLDVRRQDDSPASLLADAMLLWGTNVLVFGLWYWATDQGGPLGRVGAAHPNPDLLFPQYAQGTATRWQPRMFDYLFLGFISSTTFGPADTLPLTRRAKFLMMLQVIVSLILLSFIAARALSIIGNS